MKHAKYCLLVGYAKINEPNTKHTDNTNGSNNYSHMHFTDHLVDKALVAPTPRLNAGEFFVTREDLQIRNARRRNVLH